MILNQFDACGRSKKIDWTALIESDCRALEPLLGREAAARYAPLA
ncbi:hypothetical protein GA0061105_12058 [Rhizobium aethiopicum]|uniref:Uncharacterized protein n=1 Tax=Rhizobium aethiopicum TaxID=1138170 RepID=A0A1C3YB78_9HYPH|nr:hypothetical protein GA0061105_12058 [Rhizobium aethiopicum]